MNKCSRGRAAVLAKTAPPTEPAGLTILECSHRAGYQRLNTVAVTSDGTLTAIEVKTAEPDAIRAAATITTGRMPRTMHAAAARMHARDARYTGCRVTVMVSRKDGSAGAAAGQGEGDGAAS